MLAQLRRRSLLAMVTLLAAPGTVTAFGGGVGRRKSHNDAMFPRDAFPEPTFDANAPHCIAEREPCGFYSFSLNGNLPFKWVKSWCRCSPEHECVFDRTDMKMRVFRQVCMPTNRSYLGTKPSKKLDDGEAAAIRRRHRHAHRRHRHMVTAAERIADETTVAPGS